MDADPEAMTILIQLLVLLGLTLVNAFFAGAEMAVVSVNKNKIKKLAEEGNKNARLIEELLKNSTSFLSTIQVAITFAGFFSSASAATGISQILSEKLSQWNILYSESIAVVLVTIILSYFTLVFGELIPKRIALQKAETFSLISVRPIYFISKIMAPFIALLSFSTNSFLHLFGMDKNQLEEEVSEEEIKAMLEMGKETGIFNKMEQEMITSIFSFDDKKAKEAMTPRQEITAIDINELTDKALEEALLSKHTSIPVYEDDIDHIVGVLSMKDYMIEQKNQSFTTEMIKAIIKEPYFIPENKKMDELFIQMQKDKIRMVILIDEYGGVSGLVTIEDLIEEIVGDLEEEYEESEPELVALEKNKYRVLGSMLLKDLEDTLSLDIESHYDTVSGYLIEQMGYIPKVPELPISITTQRVRYQIVDMKDKVISHIELELK